MRVGILGTGTMAAALAEAWCRRGHSVVVAGRSASKAAAVAAKLAGEATATTPGAIAGESDVIVIAVAWEGLEGILRAAHADAGSMAGMPVIDCTNAVDYATGLLRPATGSAVELVASVARGAHAVKALHLYAGEGWLVTPSPGARRRVVAMCGDDANALDVAGALVRDLGGEPAVIGGLECGRQLEEVAGFVMRLVRAGVDPTTAVPAVAAR